MPLYTHYQNLDLEIEAHAGAYRAHVINSPVGQVAWTPVTLPFSAKELQQARALFGQVRHLRADDDSEPPLDPKQFGVQLYNSLFGGAIGDCLQRSLERVEGETGLRIRLRLNDAPDLADLPWEYLCAPPPFDFFALSTRTPIVRYLATPSAEAPLLASLPLRILVVIANPASAKFPPLDVEAEWLKLQTALADLLRRQLVVLERLETASLDTLSARLRITAEKEPIHLLHFIGHGGTGVLAFVDQTGQPHEVAAETLGKLLREHRPLRLVFLNACEGGRSDASDIFTGVAPQLVQQEVPAVIAMKYAVTDRAAIDLATRFYEAIADGYPVDAALAEARRGLYTTSASVEWGTPLLFMRATDSALIDPLDLATIPACPYPGMVPFSAKDARFFFGRTEEIAAMRRHLRNQQQLFVIGPSGSGKSSLVFAGLLPELANKEPGKWQVRVLRPGATPHSRLQEAVGDLITLAPTIARQKASGDAQHLLLVVDQFEELFVQNAKPDQNAFIAQLKAIRQLARVALVVTMRADFYPDLMNSDFWPVDASQRMEIAPLRGEFLRAAIEEPAKLVKVMLESGLIERLRADAADEPGVLPLLQETMILLWGEQKRRVLPLAAYHALGTQGRSGLAVAMATKADATLANLSPQQQTIARRIFLRLVQFGEGRSDTRRQQSVGDLRQVDADGKLVDETLTTLVDNRLLTLSGEASDPERKVDIAHEMLIVGWPTSQSWVQSRREAELTRRRLEEKAKEWVRLGKSSGGLLDEAELAEAERWMASTDAGDLGCSNDLRRLTEKSRQEIQKVAEEKEAARQVELVRAQQLAAEQKKVADEQRMRSRQFRIAAMIAGVLTLLAALFGVRSTQNANLASTKEAEAQAAVATATRALATSVIALSDAISANKTAEARRQEAVDAQAEAQVAATEAARSAADAKLQANNAEAVSTIAVANAATANARFNADGQLVAKLALLVASSLIAEQTPTFSNSVIPTATAEAIQTVLSVAQIRTGSQDDSFIRRQGNQFVLRGVPFKFIGVSIRGLIHYGDAQTMAFTQSEHQDVSLQAANDMGARVVQIYLPSIHASTTETIDRLAETLSIIHNHYPNLYLIPVLTSRYGDTPFKVPGDEKFYARIDPNFPVDMLLPEYYASGYRQNYLPYVEHIVNRFKDEPHIFAWQLGTDIATSSPELLTQFIHAVAQRIKEVDTNHLVTTGVSGTSLTSGMGGNQKLRLELYNSLAIDFISIAAYNEEYGHDDSDLAHLLNKPFIVEAGFGRQYGNDRADVINKDLKRWFRRAGSGYIQWGFMATEIDIGDGDFDSGMDKILHSDWDSLFCVYKTYAQILNSQAEFIAEPDPDTTPDC